MSDKHSLILEFLGLNPGEWQDPRVEEYFAKEYGALAKLLDSHAAEQREMCSKTCKTYINAAISTGELDNGIGQYVIDVVLEACLSATGESDG